MPTKPKQTPLAIALQKRNLKPGQVAADLTARVGHVVYPSTVWTWVKGTSTPRVPVALHLAELLGVDLRDLFPT